MGDVTEQKHCSENSYKILLGEPEFPSAILVTLPVMFTGFQKPVAVLDFNRITSASVEINVFTVMAAYEFR